MEKDPKNSYVKKLNEFLLFDFFEDMFETVASMKIVESKKEAEEEKSDYNTDVNRYGLIWIEAPMCTSVVEFSVYLDKNNPKLYLRLDNVYCEELIPNKNKMKEFVKSFEVKEYHFDNFKEEFDKFIKNEFFEKLCEYVEIEEGSIDKEKLSFNAKLSDKYSENAYEKVEIYPSINSDIEGFFNYKTNLFKKYPILISTKNLLQEQNMDLNKDFYKHNTQNIFNVYTDYDHQSNNEFCTFVYKGYIWNTKTSIVKEIFEQNIKSSSVEYKILFGND